MLRQIEWTDEFYSSVHSFFAGTSPVHPVFGACGIMLTHCHSPARPHLQSISNALCLIAVMGLGIKQGETITVTVEGDDETARNDRRRSFRAVFCVMQ